ncbi:hypothetical protein [Limnoglobus roseus]|uniref:Uncharacterized protein n=1 Tax=Limnoglobus roseus TaxID=2598579 RepID=A0A5C1A8R1_9BACT|nr:hypothetical protein [Limnoglobus roseus]QEL13478.1 hypothetical protein PX52LOC_00335 [Limnoglobus roseus]
MRPILSISFLATLGLAVMPAAAQSPPPGLLPPSITGRPVPEAVTPVAASVPKQPSIARFQNLQNYPPDTASTVLGMRAAAEWLAKRQQPQGRFLFGVNPALRTPIDGDSDYRQALATWAVCQAANFTADEKLTACGGQAVLGLLALTKDDPADATCKTPTLLPTGGNPVGFAAALALSIYSLPTADPKLLAEAEKLCGFLRKQVQADGSVACGDDADAVNVYPGLALQALAASRRVRPEAAKDAVLAKSLAQYRTKFKAAPHANFAGTMIPAAAEFCLETKDANAAGMVFEMADWLCAAQYGKADGQHVLWAGAFRTDSLPAATEPGFESAHAVRGLAAACQLIRQGVPDLTRYPKYRAAAVEGLAFTRGLQFTVENTGHFMADFRTQYLLGGVRTALTDGNIRADATALAGLAFQRFLESGAEQQ